MPTLSVPVRLALAALAIGLVAFAGLGGPKAVLLILFVALLPVVMAARAGKAIDRDRPEGPRGPGENGRHSPDR